MKKLAIAMLLAGSTYLMADGAALYAKCKGCHGADGKNAAISGVAIAGSDTVAAKLKGYQNGEGGAKKGMMMGQVKGLSDQDIADLAAYIKGL